MKLAYSLIFAVVVSGGSILTAENSKDCETVSDEASALAVKAPSSVAEIVEKAVKERPDCVSSIVKKVIKGLEAEEDSDVVVSIVEAAVEAADDQVVLIAESAMAVSPKSSDAIIAFVDATYGQGSAARLGLAGRPNLGRTGTGNNFVVPPAYGGGVPSGGSVPPADEGDTPAGGGSTGGGTPPVGTPGDPQS